MPAPEPDGLETGSTFAGRYQIIEELGRGGMGRVYKVIDKEVQAKVALKLIRPEIAFDQPTIDRFRQELKTARGISHRNICRMYDLGHHGSTYFLTMEYVPGEDLKSMIAMSGQLGVGTAISIAKQVCDGLVEAHRLGIVHRDLKPQNIQIDKGGHAKIMDFGIARSVVAKGLTDGGVAIGTPQYMSPEQVEARGVDTRSDIYALGVILYEMLTGRVPFDGDTPLAVAMRHKLEAPPDPAGLNASIPADLSRLILKCLEKDKEQRYQSAGAVHEDLVRIEQGLPTTAKVVPQPRPMTSKEMTVHLTMRQLLVPGLLAVALLAVGLGAWYYWPRQATGVTPGAPADKPRLAVLYFENISGDAALNTWRTGLPELLNTSLMQSRLLSVVSSDTTFSILKRLKLDTAARYSAEDLASVAKESHAQYLLTGSVMKAGQATVITTRLQKAATGEVLRSEKFECGKEEEILAKVDELAKRIKGDLNLSPQQIAGDTASPLFQVLSSSPDALRYYTEGMRLQFNADYRNAIPLFERATAADPGFAMAYRALANAYHNLGGHTAKRDSAINKALELRGSLPPRFRSYIELAAYWYSPKTYPQIVEVGNRLLAEYPDDFHVLNYVSLVACAVEENTRCAELREAVVKVAPTWMYTANLADVLARLGRYEERRALLERYAERDPANASAHVRLGNGFVFTAQFQDALREAEAATHINPSNAAAVLIRGDVALLRGDFATAEREYASPPVNATSAEQAAAMVRLGLLHLTLGRFEKALAELRAGGVPGQSNAWPMWGELDRGNFGQAAKEARDALSRPHLASDPSWVPPLSIALGLAYAGAGDLVRAQQTLDDLRSFREGLFVKPKARAMLALSGAIALRRGQAKAAVTDLNQALSMLPFPSNFGDWRGGFLDLLARAHAAAGDLTKARQTYEEITTLTTGRMSYGATYARSFYHLGLIAEKQGDNARAREHFTRFLEIWKDADPGQPEVADARRRLAQ